MDVWADDKRGICAVECGDDVGRKASGVESGLVFKVLRDQL